MDSGDFAHIFDERNESVLHVRKEAIIAFAAAEPVPEIDGAPDYNTTIWLTTGDTINVVANVGDVAKAIYDDVVSRA